MAGVAGGFLMPGPVRPLAVKKNRGNPEADIQRDIVAKLRWALLPGDRFHHSPNEVRGSSPAHRLLQGILKGMGLCPGFSDLIVLAQGKTVFLEVKTETGKQNKAQRDFEADMVAQGHHYEVVRSWDDVVAALGRAGVKTRVRSWL